MSGRPDISMTAGEIDRFLGSRFEAVIAAVGVGPPGAAMAAFQLGSDGTASFELSADDPILALLATDDRVCCAVEEFPSYFEIRGVMLHGHARRRHGDEAPDRAVFDLEVEKTVSFDFGKLEGLP